MTLTSGRVAEEIRIIRFSIAESLGEQVSCRPARWAEGRAEPPGAQTELSDDEDDFADVGAAFHE